MHWGSNEEIVAKNTSGVLLVTQHELITNVELLPKLSLKRLSLIEDDVDLRAVIQKYYENWGYQVSTFGNAESFLASLPKGVDRSGNKLPDLIVSDLVLPDISGIQLVEALNRLQINVPIIIATAHDSVETAANAMATGAFDYIVKPINFSELKVVSGRALRLREIENKYWELRDKSQSESQYGHLVGKSKKMHELFEMIERVSRSISNVLITGESGTGKELVAKMIHEKSVRAKGPFVSINCAAIPMELIESELFGYKKGAFTGAIQNRIGLFEEANGGTIFLDEIGDMPLSLQCKMLRVLQDRMVRAVGANDSVEIDVRVIAATNKDLVSQIKEKKFREDLFYRLCVIPLFIPPLRERTEDVELLSEHFLQKHLTVTGKSGGSRKTLSKDAIERLKSHAWPGNVRELENLIERTLVLCDRNVIEPSDLDVILAKPGNPIYEGFKEMPSLDQLEKQYIDFVLSKTEGHKEQAAKILGIDRKTLRRKTND